MRSLSLVLTAKMRATTPPYFKTRGTFERFTTLHCSGVPGYHHCAPRAIPNSAPVSMSYEAFGSTTASCLSWG